jgi:hypothetical protein
MTDPIRGTGARTENSQALDWCLVGMREMDQYMEEDGVHQGLHRYEPEGSYQEH